MYDRRPEPDADSMTVSRLYSIGSATTIYARYARIAGTFCILAGADESLLTGWIAIGMERRERADRVTAWQDWEPGGVAG